jgi:nucleotide-binding universal stress UspA family protein
MTANKLQSIIHPTDFSPESLDAFAHALRLAVAAKSLLHILHIGEENAESSWGRFPRVRDVLTQWGMIPAGATRADVASQLGVKVVKAAIESKDTAFGVAAYASRHPCDLMVLLTHERSGLRRWVQGSVAEATARQARAPALFLREGQRGFIDSDSGAVLLRTVLLPIDASVSPLAAWRLTADLARLLEPSIEIHLLHVGEEPLAFQGLLPHVELRQGPVVETILSYARDIGADLIAMPTAGHHGVFDALRGSTTERVLHEAPCPLLAIPAD